MSSHTEAKDRSRTREVDCHPSAFSSEKARNQVPKWRKFLGAPKPPGHLSGSEVAVDEFKTRPVKSSLGILNDRETTEVPGA